MLFDTRIGPFMVSKAQAAWMRKKAVELTPAHYVEPNLSAVIRKLIDEAIAADKVRELLAQAEKRTPEKAAAKAAA